ADSILNVGTTEGLVVVTSTTSVLTPVPANQAVELRVQRIPQGSLPPRTTATPLPAAVRVRIEQQAQSAISAAAAVTFRPKLASVGNNAGAQARTADNNSNTNTASPATTAE